MKVQFSAPHRRSISVTMRVLEKSIDELAGALSPANPPPLTRQYTDEIPDERKLHILSVIEEIRNAMGKMLEKYELNVEEQSMERILDAKKSYLWTILENSKSKRMKGYGDFPEELKAEYDQEIQSIIYLIESL